MKKYYKMIKCKFGAILMSEFKMPHRVRLGIIFLFKLLQWTMKPVKLFAYQSRLQVKDLLNAY